ncbi:helix-turn-helix domain-containing protein [Methylobacterium sp. J-067]|uniref:helix-turn-helix domain-containing protein n=1 Tax=Methylobacterium sp. J-067 TaxID=2836648 RepID=UPI001FB9F55D|nr:helix-turn-helix domain-containing protein [Methylobacterium sp. J-067]MCJ2024970.1 helix-turn-helix domain-containing protein [Methylobacterium sp. J-067]
MNTYADAIRRQAEDAPRAALPAVASAMWRAYAEEQITEAEAETLAVLIEARRLSSAAHSGGQSPNPTGTPTARVTNAPHDRQRSPRAATGSRPRTDASLERRRRWAASGRLPPALAARFSLAEQSALSIVAAETARRGDCRLSVPHLAAVAGVAETTVRNAIREARKLGLLTVEERRVTGFRNLPNVVRIVSPEWTAWLRLARKGAPPRDALAPKGIMDRSPLSRGGGCKFPNRTSTQVLEQGKTRPCQLPKSGIAVPVSPSRSRSRKAGA